MGRPLKIGKLIAAYNSGKDIGFPYVETLTSPVTPDGLSAGEFYGVIGGNIQSNGAAAGGVTGNPVVSVRVRISGQNEEDGFIVTQKGASKYLVYGASSGEFGVCILVDKADSTLAEGDMTATVELDDSTPFRLKRFTNKWGIDFNNTRYFLNMFQGVAGETAIKSGTAQVPVTIARIETAVI